MSAQRGFARDPDLAVECAYIRRRCPWCERRLRPCNMARHVAAAHHHQLTVYDMPGVGLPHGKRSPDAKRAV